jgi:rhodanese-related sulfurtransferase
MSGISAARFLLFDGLGSLLYGACFVFLGFFFSAQIEQVVAALSSIGGSALSLIIALVAIYIAYKYWQRHRLLRELRMARITVAELRQKLDAGEDVVILDLRSAAALQQDPLRIQGAIHINLDQIEQREHELPRDRDIIVYCSCPNEVSSARVALRLQRKGFNRVRPLLGGIDAWREQNYPLEPRAEIVAGAASTASVNQNPVSLNTLTPTIDASPSPAPARRDKHDRNA